jgi:hypothetical protein
MPKDYTRIEPRNEMLDNHFALYTLLQQGGTKHGQWFTVTASKGMLVAPAKRDSERRFEPDWERAIDITGATWDDEKHVIVVQASADEPVQVTYPGDMPS